MVDGSGARTALSAAVDEAGVPVAAERVQSMLFPAEEVADLPVQQQDRATALRVRKAGRPPGAVNRRTATVRDYVLSLGLHPLVGLVQTYSRPVHVLAAELGCTLLEAMRIQLDASRVVLEYVEGKMPVTVNANVNGGISLILEQVGAPAPSVLDGEFFQPLSDAGEPKLEDGKLEDNG